MDRKQMMQQLRNLRSKSNNPPVKQNNIIKYEKPLPKKSADVLLIPGNSALERRKKAEKILEQKQYIQELKIEKSNKPVLQPVPKNSNQPKKCNSCSRKKTQ